MPHFETQNSPRAQGTQSAVGEIVQPPEVSVRIVHLDALLPSKLGGIDPSPVWSNELSRLPLDQG